MTKLNCSAKTEQKRNLAALQVWESNFSTGEDHVSFTNFNHYKNHFNIKDWIEMNELNL